MSDKKNEKIDINALVQKSEEMIENNSVEEDNMNKKIKVERDEPVKSEPKEYDGPGLVIQKKEPQEEVNPLDFTKMNYDSKQAVNKYLEDMDKEIEEYEEDFGEYMEEYLENKEKAEKNENTDKKDDDDDDEEDDMVDKDADPREFMDKYNEAIVVIDKTGMGSVIDFTDEEREKLEKVKKIKLEEVETVELKQIKTKRAKKGRAKKIINKVNKTRHTPVVLPISGFTVTMSGCSTYELLTLITDEGNPVELQRSKWSLIHSKIVDTSIGKLSFDDFLNNVAQMEYDVLVYGILCASYPEKDKFPLKCPKCGTSFEHEYDIRSLLRAEKMSEKLMDAVAHVVDCSVREEDAKECHENSLLNQDLVIKLPQSGYIFRLGVQTAHDFIENSVDAIDRLDQKYAQSAIIASAVRSIFIEDPDDGEYFEIDDTEDVIETIFSLQNTDLVVLGKKITELVDDMSFEFGLMNIDCPDRKCKQHTNSIPIEIDTILFHKYRQVMNTNIE